MKVLLSTLNSKFIHSNLAIGYLQEYVKDFVQVETMEFTINQNIDLIVSEIYKKNPDILGFSTYIWNLVETFQICEILKMVKPDLKIILGGPEVSYDPREILEKNSFIDFIIYGEGEETFKEILQYMIEGRVDYHNIKGLVYRNKEEIIENLPRGLIMDLDKIPSPYNKVDNRFENKIIYYESSRGCPFNCEFCLSSTIQGVRFFSIDRVKKDLDNLISANVRQVKFVDRTFNANKKYAMEIMNYIIERDPKDINFHFEVTAHLIDEELLDFLSQVKEGLFQFEIGVQSTNPKTIDVIGRSTDFDKLTEVTKKIKSFKNIHQHLDLIAGLPYEDYITFKKSFNDVYAIKPEKIQLGFLKLLKGSGLRMDEEKYGYKYLNIPPYEVLENNFINYGDLIKLKGIEELVEKYYNEKYFKHSLEFMVRNYYNTPFDFYEDFADYWDIRGYNKLSHSRRGLYNILFSFYKWKDYDYGPIFNELLKYDFLKNNPRTPLPDYISRDNKNMALIQRNFHDILKDEVLLEEILPHYMNLPTKEVMKNISIEEFKIPVFEIVDKGYDSLIEEIPMFILFDYQDGVINRCNTYDITQIVRRLI